MSNDEEIFALNAKRIRLKSFMNLKVGLSRFFLFFVILSCGSELHEDQQLSFEEVLEITNMKGVQREIHLLELGFDLCNSNLKGNKLYCRDHSKKNSEEGFFIEDGATKYFTYDRDCYMRILKRIKSDFIYNEKNQIYEQDSLLVSISSEMIGDSPRFGFNIQILKDDD